jgi:hypothetical protein
MVSTLSKSRRSLFSVTRSEYFKVSPARERCIARSLTTGADRLYFLKLLMSRCPVTSIAFSIGTSDSSKRVIPVLRPVLFVIFFPLREATELQSFLVKEARWLRPTGTELNHTGSETLNLIFADKKKGWQRSASLVGNFGQ